MAVDVATTPRRGRLAPQLGLVVAAAVALNLLMKAVEDGLARGAEGGGSPAGNGVRSWLGWVVGDTTEAQFYKTALAGIGMVVFAAGAHLASRHRARGFAISYGTGLWPWVAASAAGGLVLANLLWGWSLSGGDWQPTFVAFVSVPPAIVLVYGAGWRVAATGAVLGAVLTTPGSLLVHNYFCVPLDLPAVIANVTGMWAGALLAFLICRRLPWMRRPEPAADDAPAQEPRAWLPRRALADFTEAQFYGNEWASLGLLAGAVLAWALNPVGPAYGSGVFPDLLTAQILTAALAVWLHEARWRRHGWYPTFVPVVSLAPAAVIVLDGGWRVVIVAAVAGAVVGPPLARAIAVRLPGDFHPFIGSVMSMTIITLAGIPALRVLRSAGLV